VTLYRLQTDRERKMNVLKSGIRNILFATDFSECSEAPKQVAKMFAKEYRAELTVLYVIEPAAINIPSFFEHAPVAPVYEQVRNSVEKQMSVQFTKNQHSRIKISGIIEQGGIVDTINEYAEKLNTDFIVMGTQGRLGLNLAILGSVAEKVVRTSSIPVLTVRVSDKKPRIKNILFTTDFSEYSFKALPHAIAIAKRFNAKLFQVYVMEPVGFDPAKPQKHYPDDNLSEYIETSALDLFQTLRKKTDTGNLDVSQEVIAGFAPHIEILEYIDEKDIDLVVMATHGHSGLKHMFTGSTTERVVRLAPCPVLSIKS